MFNVTEEASELHGSNMSLAVTTPSSAIKEPAPPTAIPFDSITQPTCQWILYAGINNSKVRVWDVSILIPNCLFLLFLLLYIRGAVVKLRASSSPIFTVFFGLVMAVSIISVLRCIVSMTVNAAVDAGDKTDKILWLLLRFFLLATEVSVVIFGLAFGHLDSRTSIQRVLLVTFSFALIYSVIQGALEFEYEHPVFSKDKNSTSESDFDLFAHGGMTFFFISSFLYFLIYVAILIMPFTSLRERYQLPTKKLFYYYCGFLASLNVAQAVSALALYLGEIHSLCVLDVTTYIYFSFFNPLVYCVFLWKFFWSKDTGVQFSYKHQEDLIDDDQLSLPYSGAATKQEDHAPIFSYDSTHFDVYFSQSTASGGSGGGGLSNSGREVMPTMSVNSESYNGEIPSPTSSTS